MTKRKSDSVNNCLRVLSPAELGAKVKEPYFISHLLAPERIHDCYFLVGESHIDKVGAVKQMLLAHSSYFRASLHEDKRNEPETILAPDVSPSTIKNLLRYVYGYDTTSSLSFDEANGLLYAANKFVLDSLRNNVAAHLASLLTYGNICNLLNNPACSQQLFLRSAINKILQYETEKVLENPSFLDLNVDGFVKILVQDALKVPEIELWRAALKWATKRVGSNEGRALRNELKEPLKHIRLCSLNPMDLCKEVVPTGILTDEEVRLVSISVGLGTKQSGLVSICNETSLRRNAEQPQPDVVVSDIHTTIFPGFTPKSRIKVMSLGINTKDFTVELLPFEFTAKQRPQYEDSERYECNCSLQVINEIQDSTIYIGFSQLIKYGEAFTVPIQSKGENVKLLPNSEYTVKMNFSQPVWYYSSWGSPTYSNLHFDVKFTEQKDGWFLSPIRKLSYKC